MPQQDLVKLLQDNWQLERDGAEMYASLASQEKLSARKEIFQKLSESETKHAEAWEKRLADLGATPPGHRLPSADGRQHKLGLDDSPVGFLDTLREIEQEESRDVAAYLQQLRDISDEETRAILREVVLDEFAHAHVLSRLHNQSGDGSALEYLVRRQRRGTGSWIGDAIYGVNDGLGAIFGIVSGVSGATLGDSHFVLLAGIAGMVASALSMGSGAYLAAKSEREIFEAELFRERDAFQDHPEMAKRELSLYYQLKGVPEEDADKIADYLAVSEDQFLRTMTAEKLNLTEDALANPVTSALSGSVSTAIGAFIPIIPFFFMSGIPAVIAAAVISLIAHFAVGAAKSLITVRSWWSSGLEMTLVGAVEGVVTYAIGVGLGKVGA